MKRARKCCILSSAAEGQGKTRLLIITYERVRAWKKRRKSIDAPLQTVLLSLQQFQISNRYEFRD